MNNKYSQYCFDNQIFEDVKKINQDIEKEQDPNELLKLRLRLMNKGFELNSKYYGRVRGGYYPY